MKQVLFLCSANYYRSRFAEHFFNWLAEANGTRWRAASRGLAVGRWGHIPGMSRYTVDRLRACGVPLLETRDPQQLSEDDLARADLTIALKEGEHRQMVGELFPHWVDRVEYWQIDDLDCAEPEDALPILEDRLRALAERLRDGHGL
jgi:protein-tyrosine phosphatase